MEIEKGRQTKESARAQVWPLELWAQLSSHASFYSEGRGGNVTQLEETFPGISFQSHSPAARVEETTKGQHEAPNSGPLFLGKEKIRKEARRS